MKSIDGIHFKLIGSPSFNKKTGLYMAYPKTKSIIIADTTNWSTKYTLKDDKVIKINIDYCKFIILFQL